MVTLNFTILISCGLTDDKESKSRNYLEQKVNSDSEGTLKLGSFNKTNGYEQNIMGIEIYVLEWQAEISAQQDIWKGSEGISGYGYWSDFRTMTEEPRQWMMSTPAKQFNKGTIVQYTGKCALQKTEQGWRVKELTIGTWKVLNEGNAQPDKPEVKPDAAPVNPATNSTPSSSAAIKSYSGNVGKLDAYYNLTWNPDGTIEGTYQYPKRPNVTYVLKGKDLGNGKISLTEYTGNKVSANCNLSLQDNCYTGEMNNTDGRVLKMTMCLTLSKIQ